MPCGNLHISLTSAQSAFPIKDAMIRIYKIENNEVSDEFFDITNGMGSSHTLSLPCDNEQEYTSYNVEIKHYNYRTIEIFSIQIFRDIDSNLKIHLIPDETHHLRDVYHIPPHTLITQRPFSFSNQKMKYHIPKSICVHLGKRNENSENINIDFISYIKNVAASELNPYYPKELLKAYIISIVSFVLQRVHSKYYYKKGYSFDVCNTYDDDLIFVLNRNTFQCIDTIVDEVFNEYLQCTNESYIFSIEKAQELASQGQKAFEILKNLYDDKLQLATINHIQNIDYAYPGVYVKANDDTKDFQTMKLKLGKIIEYYPFTNSSNYNEELILAFQKHFQLKKSGVIDKATWYRISYVYESILNFESIKSSFLPNTQDTPFTFPCCWGSLQKDVALIQMLLKSISLFDFRIKDVKVDQIFKSDTHESVLSFQKAYHLQESGIVDEVVWNTLFKIYHAFTDNIFSTSITNMQIENATKDGLLIKNIKNALNIIGSIFSNIPVLVCNELYDQDTKQAITIFQKDINLNETGDMNQETLKYLFILKNEIENGITPSYGLLQYNHVSEDEKDSIIISRLNKIASVYPDIPTIDKKNREDKQMYNCILAFQKILGLQENGLMDKNVWDMMNKMYFQLIQ